MSDTAIQRVRRFAAPPEGTGELVVVDPALFDQAPPEDVERQGIATLDDVEGRHPALAIKTSFKDALDEVVTVVAIDFTPTPAQFLTEKRARGLDPETMTAVVTWRGADGRYYTAVSGNGRMMRQAPILANLLRRVEGVRCRVVSFPTAGGTGYGLGLVGDPA